MTARTAAAAASFTLALTLVACTNFYEVPIETPIQPKMDVSAFQRVLIAGFLAGRLGGRRRESRDRAAAAQPAAIEVVAARDRRRRAAADGPGQPSSATSTRGPGHRRCRRHHGRHDTAAVDTAAVNTATGNTTTGDAAQATPPAAAVDQRRVDDAADRRARDEWQASRRTLRRSADPTRIKDEKDLQPLEGDLRERGLLEEDRRGISRTR